MKKTLFFVFVILFANFLTFSQNQRGSNNVIISNSTYAQAQTKNVGHHYGRIGNFNININSINPKLCDDTLLFEDFQSKLIPVTWLNSDLDGNTDANGRPAEFYIYPDDQHTTIGDTNWVAASSSWFSPMGQANDWLITNQLCICSSDFVLTWKSAPFEGPSFCDGYKVLVSKTGTNLVDFTDTVAVFAESVNGTATMSAGIVHTDYNGTRGLLQEWEVNLSGYAGECIYIAFVHDSNDDNLIILDDICVHSSIEYDIELLSKNIDHFYKKTPLNQFQPVSPNGRVLNKGAQILTNPTLTVNAFLNSNIVYSETKSIAQLVPNEDTLLTVNNPFLPTVIGVYDFQFIASMDEVDETPLNDTMYGYTELTDTVYSLLSGDYTGALSIGTGVAGLLGTQFEIFQTDYLTSITVNLSSPSVDMKVVGKVYNMNAGVPDLLIATTDSVLVSAGVPGTYTLPLENAFFELAPGSYVITIEEPVDGSVSLYTNTESYVPGLSWVYFNGLWHNPEFYSFPVAFALNANFGEVCYFVPDFSYYATELSVDFTNTSTTYGDVTYSWNFGDGNTSTNENPSHTYASSGTYTVVLTLNNSCYTDQISYNVTVCKPTANFSYANNDLVVDFTNSSTYSGTANYSWNFGDGTTSTDENPVHIYATDGTYTVCFTVTDDCGEDVSCSQVDVCSVIPEFVFSSNQLTATFTNTTSVTGSVTYSWNFGDGTTSTDENPIHTYVADGTYSVCLTVNDDCGEDVSCSQVDVCSVIPEFVFSSNQLTATFTNTTTVTGSATYSWDFGDGTTSTDENPIHTYDVDGTYTVCFTVTDDCGQNFVCNTLSVSIVGLNTIYDDMINIYPNPANDYINVEFGENKTYNVVIFNNLGQKVREVLLTSYNNKINVNDLQSGIYTIKIQVDNVIINKKFSIQ